MGWHREQALIHTRPRLRLDLDVSQPSLCASQRYHVPRLNSSRSPIAQNFDTLSQYGQAYHGYWTQNINNLNTNYGTAADLTSLVTAVHAAGMYIMVDVTVNSMAWPGAHTAVDYTTFASPFNSKSAYHEFCWIDYSNSTSILECWLGDDNVALVDVATEQTSIRSTYNTWISDIVSTYKLDGIRIDAVKSVEIGFFPGFQAAAGTFAIGENYQADPTLCCEYQPSLDALLNFPLYYGLFYAFNATGGGVANLVNLMAENQGNCTDVSVFGNFVENHDLPRYAGITSDQHQRLNAIAFTFVMDGIPIVYYGQEQAFTGQADPYNREALWTSNYDTTNPYFTMISTLNQVRKNAIAQDSTFVTTNTTVIQQDIDYFVMKKGDLLSCLFNDGVYGSNATLDIPLAGYAANVQVIEVLTQNVTTTNSLGGLSVKRNAGAPMIFYLYSKWNESISKPNAEIVINTQTTATTTMTTTYVYPSAKAASSEGLLKASVSLKMMGVGLSMGLVALSAFIFI